MGQAVDTLLDYYQEKRFNPVHIRVEDASIFQRHVEKRRNLYEHHLGLPLSLLEGQRILEFGPNSGENALVFALFGARLTLVEPNDQVLPRMRELFGRFGLTDQIDAVLCQRLDEFTTNREFDLVLAEGFLYTLPNREEMLRKLVRLIAPYKFGVLSFNDRYGGFLELLRRALLFQACTLLGVNDEQSNESLDLARKLYGDDFARLNASRTFEAWWRDTLVNPFCEVDFCWSFPDILRILSEERCQFHSSSPLWATVDHYSWYKNTTPRAERDRQLLDDWRRSLPYFVTGVRPEKGDAEPASNEVIAAIDAVTTSLSRWGKKAGATGGMIPTEICGASDHPIYPLALDRFLGQNATDMIRAANDDLKRLFEALASRHIDEFWRIYRKTTAIRRLWGTAYHYLSFQRTCA
jgi:hypothetical protein